MQVQRHETPSSVYARAQMEFAPESGRTSLIGDWRAKDVAYEVPEELLIPDYSDPDVPFNGEKPSISEVWVRRLESLILQGSSIASAKSAMVHPAVTKATWAIWKARADEGKQPWANLFERCHRALAHRELTNRRVVVAASQHPDPKVAVPAAVKDLELVNPARYGTNRQKLDVTVKGRVDINVKAAAVLADVNAGDLATLLAARRQALTAPMTAASILEAAPMSADRPDEGDE